MDASQQIPGRFKIWMGPVKSHKTAKLNSAYVKRRKVQPGKTIIAVKPEGHRDNGDRSSMISSRDGTYIPALAYNFLEQVPGIEKADCVFIDELHFFYREGNFEYLQELLRRGVDVYATCLNGTFNRESWPFVDRCYPMAKVEFTEAKCEVCGKVAHFSMKKSGDPSKLVEFDDNLYGPACGDCWRPFYEAK